MQGQQGTAKQLADFIWKIANLLRGPYKRSEYGKVILPFTVLRRLDSMLEDTRAAVISTNKSLSPTLPQAIREAKLLEAAKVGYYNLHPQSLREVLVGDPGFLANNLLQYSQAFSEDVRDIFSYFKFHEVVSGLDKHKRLFLVLKEFCTIDLSTTKYPHHLMGDAYEELIRRFAEASNDEAGEHFTPREVIQLMTDLLIDGSRVAKPGLILTAYDPACGTGGMLMAMRDKIQDFNKGAQVQLFGQEHNEMTYAICKADVLIHKISANSIYYGNTLTEDKTIGQRFDFVLCNPPFGVEWKAEEKEVKMEAESLGMRGRFGAGLPPISDGQLLFLQQMLSKLHPVDEQHPHGSRMAIIFNGSPLFTGGAGSGPSDIRKWVIENDWLDAIVGLPDQMFYNTGIHTYIWVLTNAKPDERKGKVMLIDGTSFYAKMPRSAGNKRNYLTDQHIKQLGQMYWDYKEGPHCKIYPASHFGYRRVCVDRPLRLNFAATPERLSTLKVALDERTASLKEKAEKSKSQKDIQTAQEAPGRHLMLYSLAAQLPATPTIDGDAFEAELKHLAKGVGVKLSAPELKLIRTSLSERDPNAQPQLDSEGNPVPDPELRDYENIPLDEDVDEYLAREVLPYAPDAYRSLDREDAIGYEFGFTREFYQYQPPRPLSEIVADIQALEAKTEGALQRIITF